MVMDLERVSQTVPLMTALPNGVRLFYSVRATRMRLTWQTNKGMELPDRARLLGHLDVSMSYRGTII